MPVSAVQVQGENRLKRVILIGDHHQLPPVVKNPAFQKFSNLEQSMFTRLVRLGVPHIRLDCQVCVPLVLVTVIFDCFSTTRLCASGAQYGYFKFLKGL